MSKFKITREVLNKLGLEEDDMPNEFSLDLSEITGGTYQDSFVYLEVSLVGEIVNLVTFREHDCDMYHIWLPNIKTNKQLKKFLKSIRK